MSANLSNVSEHPHVPTVGTDHSLRGSAVLIGLGFLGILSLSFMTPGQNYLAAGLAFGTYFGHVVAAGFALGTRHESLVKRLAVTFLWLVVLALCFFVAVGFSTSYLREALEVSTVTAIIGLVAIVVTALALGAV